MQRNPYQKKTKGGKKRRKGGRKEGKKQAHKQVKEYVSAAGRGFLNSELCRNCEEAMIQVGEDQAGSPGLPCPSATSLLTLVNLQPRPTVHRSALLRLPPSLPLPHIPSFHLTSVTDEKIKMKYEMFGPDWL